MMHTFDCRTILEHSTRAIVLVVWLLNSWGCAFIRGNVGDEINEVSVANLKKGTTTRGEVAAMFGAPDEILHAAGREVFHYRHFDGKLGYVLIISRLNVKSDNLYVLFTPEGMVHDVVYGKRTDNLAFQVWPFGE
jgi:hypothetical protein